MPDLDDQQLLAAFVREQSESAFAELVTRYVNLVYSAALRFTGNSAHAEEITQGVFIILARKAGKLRRGPVLPGWLYQTTRLTAANFRKGEIRRQRREQEATRSRIDGARRQSGQDESRDSEACRARRSARASVAKPKVME